MRHKTFGLLSLILVNLVVLCSGNTDLQKFQEIQWMIKRMKVRCLTSGAGNVLQVPEGTEICERFFDPYFVCWPGTLANTTARVKCSPTFFHDDYIEIRCNENGEWEKVNVLSWCKILPIEERQKRKDALLLKEKVVSLKEIEEERHRAFIDKVVTNLRKYITIGDMCVCTLSLLLIIWLVPLKNKRFVLHRFLLLSIVAMDAILLALEYKMAMLECTILDFFAQYTFLVVIFLMFCEGFYQFRQFYFVFVTNQRIWTYIVFATCTPAVIVFGIFVPLMFSDPPVAFKEVCWRFTGRHKYSFLIYGPALLLLILNIFITVFMMRLIISKLRREKTSELYKTRKGLRGFLVLMFLLGGAYSITFFGGNGNEVWRIMRVIIRRSQGILICFLQVLLSQQIFGVLKKKLKKFFATQKLNLDLTRKSTINLKSSKNDRSASTSDYRNYSISESRRDSEQGNSSSYDDEKRGSTTSISNLLDYFKKPVGKRQENVPSQSPVFDVVNESAEREAHSNAAFESDVDKDVTDVVATVTEETKKNGVEPKKVCFNFKTDDKNDDQGKKTLSLNDGSNYLSMSTIKKHSIEV